MSEISTTNLTVQKSYTRIIFPIVCVMILLLVYGAGIVALPISILARYQSKKCDSVLSLNKLYTSLYPGFIQDKTLSAPVDECKAYALAVSKEESSHWQEAYDAYHFYASTYPNGLYAPEAHEHSATALLNIVQDQADGKKYEEAVANLNRIMSDYADTRASSEAWRLFPSIYTSWGIGLRDAEEFESAEQVFNEFKAWSQNNPEAEAEQVAQSEAVQTYLAWGLALQSQKQFESAIAKFEMAVSVDPQLQFASAEQVKAGQRGAYVDWGNDLLAQGEFNAALEKFELAVSKSTGKNEDGVEDALANGHIQWAHQWSAEEDFEAALEQVEIARQTAVSEAMKKSVETALAETYLAFSDSSGPQARKALKEALLSICKKHKAPELPIFGLNKDSVRVGIYGVEAQLPENVAATTPGEMHFVACVTEENQTVDERSQKVIVQRTAWGYYYMLVQQYRAQLLWNISLLRTDTMESAGKKTFTGGMPPPFPDGAMGGDYLYGPPPTTAELSDWFLSIIK